jgi:pyrroline-5-carboxylate reductase
MASALISGIIASSLIPANNIMVSDPSITTSQEKFSSMGVVSTTSNLEVSEFADVIVIAVKPDVVKLILIDINSAVNITSKSFISIAALLQECRLIKLNRIFQVLKVS